jgi:hypothetical protein
LVTITTKCPEGHELEPLKRLARRGLTVKTAKTVTKKKKHKVDLQQQQKGIKDVKLKINALEEFCNTMTD